MSAVDDLLRLRALQARAEVERYAPLPAPYRTVERDLRECIHILAEALGCPRRRTT